MNPERSFPNEGDVGAGQVLGDSSTVLSGDWVSTDIANARLVRAAAASSSPVGGLADLGAQLRRPTSDRERPITEARMWLKDPSMQAREPRQARSPYGSERNVMRGS